MNAGKSTRSSARLYSPLAVALMCALGLNLGSSSAQAQSIDEPVTGPVESLFQGQTTYSRQQGDVRMEISGSHQRDGEIRNNEIVGRAEYGITNRLQAQVSLPLDIADRSGTVAAQTGMSRVEVGAKYSVMPTSSPVSLSAGMDVAVPLGSQDVMGTRPSAGPTFKPMIAAGVGSNDLQVQASLQGELGQPSRGLNSTVAGMYSLGAITPSLELSSMASESAKPEFYATPGVTYKFSDRTQVGLGAAIGLNDQSQDLQVMGKLSVNLGR